MSRGARALAAASLLVLLAQIVAYAWVTDDAFISFRSVGNFVEGYGPVFNRGERVQAFTHPLWLLLLSAGHAAGVPLFYWAMALGGLASAALLAALYRQFRDLPAGGFGFGLVFLLLISSDAFLSFQTSGLESSLTALLLVLFFASVPPADGSRPLLRTTLLAALLLTNRLDQVFLILPTLLYAYAASPLPAARKLRPALLGAAPLAAWEVFSLVYYGFLFPNPKYAKLGGRGALESLASGLDYLADYARFEPAQVALILLLPMLVIARAARREPHGARAAALALGVLAQVVYVIAAGGDFMRGRFFHGPLVAACFLLLLWLREAPTPAPRARRAALALVGLAAVYSRAAFEVPVPGEHHAVHNERNYYKAHLALDLRDPDRYREHPWAVSGRQLSRGDPPALVGMNGQWSHYVDPRVDLIDDLGLTDAFVARAPVVDAARSGHFARRIPAEYLRERLTGERQEGWQDRELERLWRDLEIVIRSEPLLSRRRLSAVLRVWSEHGP